MGAVAAGITVDFSTASKTLVLDNIAEFDATIVDFNQGEDYYDNAIENDEIVIEGLPSPASDARAHADADAASSGLTIEYVQSSADSGVLEFIDDGVTVANLMFYGTYTTADFTLTESGNEIVVGAPVCYAPGTMIATPSGERPIEELREGDTVSLFDGGTAPIIWIGRRRVRCEDHPHPETVCPVRIRAGAFGGGMPRRDLVLSPQHAIFHGGALFPINTLINGRSVVQEATKCQVYLHLELPMHALLLAEGMPAESYLDTGNRHLFANAALAHLAAAGFAEPCADMHFAGPRVEALRSYLEEVARSRSGPVADPAIASCA